MNGTIIQQGRFTSAGAAVDLNLRSDFDWIRVWNETALAQDAADLGAEFYFQRGMADGRGVIYTKLGNVVSDPMTIGQIAASAGFSRIDSSTGEVGSPVAITGASNVVRPIISTSSTAGVTAGTVVRLASVTGAVNLSGYDFAVDTIVANTSFRLAGALATAPGNAGTAGTYRIVSYDPIYAPTHRFITNITQAAQAVITLTVPSGYAVGQKVKFVVPDTKSGTTAIYGMTEIDGLVGTITAVNDAVATQTITVDIDSTGFSAFTFPTHTQATAVGAYSKAIVVPFGMNTATALSNSVDILSGKVRNEGFIGVRLAAGISSPAGAADDVIYWQAGKAFSVDNN